MDGVVGRLTDAQVAALVAGEFDVDHDSIDGDPSIGVWGMDTIGTIVALALEAQKYRAIRSVMAAAVRDVNAGLLKPYDALARIVAELASLDSRAVADGH